MKKLFLILFIIVPFLFLFGLNNTENGEFQTEITIQEELIILETNGQQPEPQPEPSNIVTVIAYIITGIFAILALFFGFQYNKVKTALRQLLDLISEAIKDNQITGQELQKIINKVREIRDIIFGKR